MAPRPLPLTTRTVNMCVVLVHFLQEKATGHHPQLDHELPNARTTASHRRPDVCLPSGRDKTAMCHLQDSAQKLLNCALNK